MFCSTPQFPMKKNIMISIDLETYEILKTSPLGISGTISAALNDYQEMKGTIERLQQVTTQLTNMLHEHQHDGNERTTTNGNEDTQTRL